MRKQTSLRSRGSKQYKRETDNTRSAGSDNSESPRSMPGALRSPIAANADDYIFEQLALGPDRGGVTAEYIDLRPYSKPSRDQQRRGTCAAFAAAAIREIQEHMIGSVSNVLSPEFIYHHRKNRPSEGMFGRDVFMIMRNIGTVPEDMFPYVDVEPMARDSSSIIPIEPDEEHYEIARTHRFANFARVMTCAGLKRAIREVGPCYLVLPLYATRPYFWRRQPHMAGDSHGHSVAVVGYTADGFILKNSWGPTWNGDGCIVFPYADWDTHWECWAPLDRAVVPQHDIVANNHNNREPDNHNNNVDHIDMHIVLDEQPIRQVVREIKYKSKCVVM